MVVFVFLITTFILLFMIGCVTVSGGISEQEEKSK